jgi:hypothetical protein
MKQIIFIVLFSASTTQAIIPSPNVSFSAGDVEHLFIYHRVGTNKIEVIHLDQKLCQRYFIEMKSRDSNGPAFVRITSAEANPDHPGDGSEENPRGPQVGSTLIEGKYFFSKSEAYHTDLIRLETDRHFIDFVCDSGMRGWKEHWEGRVDLHSYRASLGKSGDWEVALATGRHDAFAPLTRKFFVLQPKGGNFKILPENANIRHFLTLLTNRVWFPDRRIVRKNHRLTAELRSDINRWIREEHLESYGIMVTQFDEDFDTLGEIAIYLPLWLMEPFHAQFSFRLSEVKMADHWGFEFFSTHPQWLSSEGKPVPAICVNALLSSRSDKEALDED